MNDLWRHFFVPEPLLFKSFLFPLKMKRVSALYLSALLVVALITGQAAVARRLGKAVSRSINYNNSSYDRIQKRNRTECAIDDCRQEAVHSKVLRSQMMSHAWNGYVQNAFGHNELAPVRKQPHLTGVLGSSQSLGATIVDALDTLWIMGLRSEFDRGRQWVAQNFKLADVDYAVSLFEVNIRLLGGLLSAFTLSSDRMFLDKAYELGRTLLTAFDSPSGLPWSVYNFKRKHRTGFHTSLADVGSFHLEFAYLSALTGDNTFINRANHIRNLLDKLDKSPNGLYRDHIDVGSGNWTYQRHTNVGSLGDSFYEYLIKSWLLSDRTDANAKRMFDEAMQAIDSKLVVTASDEKRQLTYFQQLDDYGWPHNNMDYMACFMGGLYAISAPYANDSAHYQLRAAQLTNTCHFASASTQTGFAPELFRISTTILSTPLFGPFNQISVTPIVSTYLLRPEVVESYFLLWRTTRNPKYRELGWAAAQAIEKHCRVDGGYSGLVDVNRANPSYYDDVQPSYFLAETLKYLYLLFVDDDDEKSTVFNRDGKRPTSADDDGGTNISLDDYVFSTEAHPFAILRNGLNSRRKEDFVYMRGDLQTWQK